MKKKSLLLFMTGLLSWTAGTVFAISEKDGVYQIGTPQDLVEFSTNIVASGNGRAAAVLTSDIDMSGVGYTPIGSMTSTYSGTFDGQQHYIRNLTVNTPDADKVGLFGVVSDGATIKNLILDEGSSITGHSFVGGIVGSTEGGGSITLENVGNEASVSASAANAAGLVGVSMGGSCAINIIHCFNTGMVNGGYESASFCGWLGGGSVIQDSYSYADIVGQDGNNSLYRNGATIKGAVYDKKAMQGKMIEEEDLYSGAFAYLLNGNQSDSPVWFQDLSESSSDAHPVPFSSHPTVYANGQLNCDGTAKQGTSVVYGNTNASLRDPHQFVDGICSVCGTLDEHFMTAAADGYYEIGTPAELAWFAAKVNKGDNTVNGRLTADIDYTAKNVSIAADRANSFHGTFDGQQHKISIAFKTTTDNTALFGYLDAATIRNLLVDGSIETTGGFAGGIFSVSVNGGLLENVVSAVNIKSTAAGDATMGGIASNSAGALQLRNVAFVGSIDAPASEGSAGLIGYTHAGEEILMQNSFVAAKMNIAKGAFMNRKAVVMDNCYYIPMDNSFENQDPGADSRATVIADGKSLADGALCYLLNGSVSGGDLWFETLGTDRFPVPFATSETVYLAGHLNCAGKVTSETTYSNEDGLAAVDEHQLNENGECTVCGNRVISTGAQLLSLQNDLAIGVVPEGVTVELKNDIDMSGVAGYVGLGTRDYPFKGIFDGKNHRVRNMSIEASEGNAGFFGFVTGGTKVKNLTVDASCDVYGEKGWTAGIIGVVVNNGGLVELENVGNEASVTAEGPNAAGIIGVAEGCLIHLTNVYNTGTVTGAKESAAISGWLSRNAVLKNVYNAGDVTVSGVDGNNTFARVQDGRITMTNCFETNGSQATTVTAEQVRNGELCYLLNGSADKGRNFFQTLDEDMHPVLDPTHKTISKEGSKYVNEAASTGIEYVTPEVSAHAAGIYTLSGSKTSQLRRGINIVRTQDGKVRKVLVK
ncbi:MAG: hypothetical protein K6A82_08170 [Prevotella sp.]|nr:hypothetical protein [Prevotella sp.]